MKEKALLTRVSSKSRNSRNGFLLPLFVSPVLDETVDWPHMVFFGPVLMLESNPDLGRNSSFFLRFKHENIFYFDAFLLSLPLDLFSGGAFFQVRDKDIPVIFYRASDSL